MLAIAGGRLRVPAFCFAGLGLWGLIFALLPYLAGDRAGLLEDDSYFYAQIAFNSQRYGIFSFDGLEVTSGFHPLWGTLLSLIARLTGFVSQDKSIHLANFFTLWIVIVVAIGTQVAKARSELAVFVGLCLLTAPLMETALLSALWVGIASLLLRMQRRPSDEVTLGALAALIPLARIDAAPFVLLWLPCVWGRRRQVAFLGLGLLFGGALHFAFLYVTFGHFVTVSSLLKAGGVAKRGLSFSAFEDLGLAVRVVVLSLLSWWGWVGLRNVKTRHENFELVFVPPVLFSFAHVVAGDLRSWHCLPGFVFSFWAGVKGREGESRGRASLVGYRLVALLTLVLTLYKSYRFVPLDEVRRSSWDFVADARNLLEPEARIYQVDGSGFTGYWIDRHLINGDGLVNTHEYAARLRKKSLHGYLEEMQVCYLITDAPLRKRRDVLVKKGGLKVVKLEASEMLRSKAYGWSANRNAHYVLWRLHRARCTS